MAIPYATQEMSLNLKGRLTPDKQGKFANAIASRVTELHTENLMKGAVVGAALSAWVGSAKDQRIKKALHSGGNKFQITPAELPSPSTLVLTLIGTIIWFIPKQPRKA